MPSTRFLTAALEFGCHVVWVHGFVTKALSSAAATYVVGVLALVAEGLLPRVWAGVRL